MLIHSLAVLATKYYVGASELRYIQAFLLTANLLFLEFFTEL